MIRIIEIDMCSSCPYNAHDCCRIEGYRIIVSINEKTGFPDWCPLPIKEENKKEEQK